MRSSLAERIGVTRVAQLAGLDRTGLPVACAVRPLGHVLQVANGKGRSSEAAAQSALGEAAELWAAERVVPEELVYGTPAGMRARYGETAIWDGDLGSAGAREGAFAADCFAAFRAGRELFRGATIYLPAAAVHCPPPGAAPLGPGLWRWTSNGMGAHPQRAPALCHALLEAVERDALAEVLPEGWTPAAIAARGLSPATLPRDLARAQRDLARRGFELRLFDLTPARTPSQAPRLPLAGALLLDREQGPVPVTAGYAARCSGPTALWAALLEAVQSRLTDIHGAREDVDPMPARAVHALRAALAAASPRRSMAAFPRPVPETLAHVKHSLWTAGHRRVAVVTLSPPGFPLSVVRAIVPSFQLSGLL